jgi:hypothetical protein
MSERLLEPHIQSKGARRFGQEGKVGKNLQPRSIHSDLLDTSDGPLLAVNGARKIGRSEQIL